MSRRLLFWSMFLLLSLQLALPRAEAVIVRLLPLKDVLAEGQFIFTARVEKFDPERPAAVFTVEEDFKGKFPFRTLPVNLTGDAEAKKLKHTPELLKRLGPDLPLVFFGTPNGKDYLLFGYTEGTWFQIVGKKVEKEDRYAWAFLHCEPYLRRTFKGTTAEMRQVVLDVLNGKRKPPEPNPKEPPGFGPELKAPRQGDRETGRQGDRETRRQGDKETEGKIPVSLSPCLPVSLSGQSPLVAVIPTIGIGGPLALLAVLFPALFGGLLILFRRWLAFLSVLSLNVTLYCLHSWFKADLYGTWWGSDQGLSVTLMAVTCLGTIWAWRRNCRSMKTEPGMVETPLKTELVILWISSLSCLGLLIYYLITGVPGWFTPWWNLFLALTAGLWLATLYRLWHTYFASRVGMARPVYLSTEGVMLWTGLFVLAGFAAARPTQHIVQTVSSDADAAGEGRPVARLVPDRRWQLLLTEHGNGMLLSSPLVAGDRAYVATAHPGAFVRPGRLHCIDLKTQAVLWTFNDDGKMKQVFSSPCLVGNRLYIGEGFHEDAGCKLYCLDVSSGEKLWEFETTSHTESSPVVVNGKVYFGAGDDGVYCLDALKGPVGGKALWQFPPPAEQGKGLHLHVDSTPAVAGNRVYVGGGFDEDTGHGDPAICCLDAATGKKVWLQRTPRWMVRKGDKAALHVPCWGSPVVDRGQVFFGIGNGRMTIPSANYEPVGGLLAVDAATGKELWPPFKVGDGVLCRPALDEHRVYFGSRDGFVYCVGRDNGKLRWKKALGSPVVATVALDYCEHCKHTAGVFAVASGGQVVCLDPFTGKVHWSHDLASEGAELIASPTVVVTHTPQGDRRRLYIGATLQGIIPALICLEDLLPER